VEWREVTPEHLSFRVSASSNVALVTNDEWMPGWEATVDGRPSPIFVTNGVVRGVAISGGTHQVEMTYRTPGLSVGVGLSALGLLLTIALTLRQGPSAAPNGEAHRAREAT
jgi:uncharacterized membrane protein YfhO